VFKILWIVAGAAIAFGAEPCDQTRSEAARQQAEHASQEGDYSRAAGSFQQAFRLCPANHELLIRLSETQSRRHAGTEAIAAANRLLLVEPTSVPGKLALADAYLMAQRLPEALQTVQSVLAVRPAEPAALKIKGNVEYLSGHSDAAIRTFLALLELHPQDADGPYMLGRIYYQEGRIEQAAGQFQRVLRLHPEAYKALDNLGLCYQALGDPEMAKRYFLTAIKLSKDQADPYDWSYANLADLLLQNGDPERAFAAASEAADRNPRSARNFYLGGKALQQLNRTDLSVNWLQRSAALDPNYPEPLYLLAKLYKQSGDTAKAATALETFRRVKAVAPRERK
jgi:tetratricopeptide (TPR) repeat protein